MTKDEVKDLQRRLNLAGEKLEVDGIAGVNTRAALARHPAMNPFVAPAAPTTEPRWVKEARKYIGLKEVPGKGNNKTILGWWKLIKAAFNNDEVPWCAGFVGAMLETVGIRSSRSAAAKSYLKWGVSLNGRPAVGAVVVFWRGRRDGPNGHVGFVIGEDKYGHLIVLSGNTSDAVLIKPFTKDRVLTYRWPLGGDTPNYNLPVLASDGRVSTNEA